MTIFATIRDLELWVAERLSEEDEGPSPIADAIRDHEDFPSWGSDFTDFLNTLPDDLSDLV